MARIIKRNIIPVIKPTPSGVEAGVKISPITPAISISIIASRFVFLDISSIPTLYQNFRKK
jgi:hypothetical protein